MKSLRLVVAVGIISILLVAGCSGTPPREQAIKGQAALTTFPVAPSQVQALMGDKVIAKADIATDGTFTLLLAPGNSYRLEFLNVDGRVAMVFPRPTGKIDTSFDIRGVTKPFDLGKVRYVGDPSAKTYIFNSTSSSLSESTSKDTDTDKVEENCEDGIDPKTGAICVNNQDDKESADNDTVECENGIDPATGSECEGGPAANPDDGTKEDATKDDGALPSMAAAVPTNNIPAVFKATDKAKEDDAKEKEGSIDNDNIECENGIDPVTGLECEGGPAANPNDEK